jgi:hypothetical protein
MRDEKIDPAFRDVAESRPKSGNVWTRIYLGGRAPLTVPVHSFAFLVPLSGVAFMFCWSWLLSWLLSALGVTGGGWPVATLLVAPIVAVWVWIVIVTLKHIEWIY